MFPLIRSHSPFAESASNWLEKGWTVDTRDLIHLETGKMTKNSKELYGFLFPVRFGKWKWCIMASTPSIHGCIESACPTTMAPFSANREYLSWRQQASVFWHRYESNLDVSMDWFKGKSTGNHGFSHQIWFSCKFSLKPIHWMSHFRKIIKKEILHHRSAFRPWSSRAFLIIIIFTTLLICRQIYEKEGAKQPTKYINIHK